MLDINKNQIQIGQKIVVSKKLYESKSDKLFT